MGDLTKLAKAKKDLEELYSGIPDDSVNLTFQDLPQVSWEQKSHSSTTEKKSPPNLDPVTEANSPRKEEVTALALNNKSFAKLPSLDFSQGLEASAKNDHQIHHQSHHLPHMHHLSYNSPLNNNNHDHQGGKHGHGHHHYGHGERSNTPHHGHHHRHASSPYGHHGVQNTMVYDDTMMSQMSMGSMMSPYPERGGGRRRPGIPHSNICTVCSTYIYIFRHRCLVCGRVYCRQCVGIGMGEMTEGRKCIECLGRRFSQRYIHRAGAIGCCMGYQSIVKKQELKWAEKGPKGSGYNSYGGGRSGMVSASRSPAPTTPSRGRGQSNYNNSNNPPSFVSNTQSSIVMGSPYSPYYSPANHPLPL